MSPWRYFGWRPQNNLSLSLHFWYLSSELGNVTTHLGTQNICNKFARNLENDSPSTFINSRFAFSERGLAQAQAQAQTQALRTRYQSWSRLWEQVISRDQGSESKLPVVIDALRASYKSWSRLWEQVTSRDLGSESKLLVVIWALRASYQSWSGLWEQVTSRDLGSENKLPVVIEAMRAS